MDFNSFLAIFSTACAAFMLYSHFKNKKQTGKLLIECKNGIRYANRFTLVIICFFILCSVPVIPTINFSEIDTVTLFMLLAVASFLVLMTVQLFAKKGLYEHGIVTSSAIILYKNVVYYDIAEETNRGTVKITINAKSGSFFGGTYVTVDQEQLNEVKALLKKSCKFKKR